MKHAPPAEFTSGIDSRAMLLARASALDELVQGGEISLDSAIEELIELIGPFLPNRCNVCGDAPPLHDESWCMAVGEGKERRRAERAEPEPEPRAAASTVEALMFGLRSGVQELGQEDTISRLSELSDAQFREVAVRLQKFQPHIAKAWTAGEIAVLITVRRKVRAENS
jgi:hypothetical protein